MPNAFPGFLVFLVCEIFQFQIIFAIFACLADSFANTRVEFAQSVENKYNTIYSMKFIVEGKQFQQQLQAVSKVISSKNTIKILDNFLLSVDGDSLMITGGDSENMLTATMPVQEVEGAGAVAVNARRLLEITKEIDNQPLTFEINDESKEIDLKFLNGHFNFMGVDAAEYPSRREMSDESLELVLPAEMVVNGIENTWFAVSNETTRPVMTGIFWDIHEGDVTFVSSDTHKLVRYIDSEKAPGMEASFILPSKTSSILKSLISKDETDVRIVFDKKGGLFEFGDYILYSVFINGNYPNYNRVIPQNSAFSLVVDRASLINALRRVNLFAPKSSNLVVLRLNQDEMVLAAQDADYGTSAEERVACSYEGNSMEIGFNGVFMVEILNNLDCTDVVMQITDPARPCIYSALEKKEGKDLVTIQMPMQVL